MLRYSHAKNRIEKLNVKQKTLANMPIGNSLII
jgi:hypothetical protein